jgi:hypothetical protein
VGMPDELFQWMLDDICVQPSAFMRQDYCSLIGQSEEQIQRLITAERLKELFERLGAAEGTADRAAEVSLTRLAEEPYKGRDWSCLRTFFTLLSSISSTLAEEPASYAVQTLLRMSLDRVLMSNIELLNEYEYAIQTLVEPIPSSSWNSFVSEGVAPRDDSLLLLLTMVTVLRDGLYAVQQGEVTRYQGQCAAVPSNK